MTGKVPQPTQQAGMTPGFYAWLVYLVKVVNNLVTGNVPSSGLKSINGDTTPAQTLAQGTGITIVDGGGGLHTISSTGSFTAGGDLSGTSSSQKVIGWESNPLDAVTMGSPSLNNIPQWDGTKWIATAPPSGGVSSVSGDGNLVNNVLSTGAVTLTLGNAAAYQFWGRNAGTTGAPGYFNLVTSTFALATDANGQVIAASRLGNTNTIAVTSGSFTPGHFITVDASNNLIDGGFPAGGVTAVTASYPLASTGGATPDITLNPLYGSSITDGYVRAVASLVYRARQSGEAIHCAIVVTASDPSIDFSFRIWQKSGGGAFTNIFSVDPVITHGALLGDTTLYTSLTSVPLPVSAGDLFYTEITSGSSDWQVTIQLE